MVNELDFTIYFSFYNILLVFLYYFNVFKIIFIKNTFYIVYKSHFKNIFGELMAFKKFF